MRVLKRPDGTLDVLGVPIWTTGTFHGFGSPPEGDRFTPEDLDLMARNMRELEDEVDPRVYAGHPLHPLLKLLARPKGRVRNIRRMGNTLYADLIGVDPAFWEAAVRDGARLSPDIAMRYVSPRTGKEYRLVITGLGVLGAHPPANTVLPPLGVSPETHYMAARAYAQDIRGRWVPTPRAVTLARLRLKP